MKMPNFSLAFLLAMVYPAVLLANRPTKSHHTLSSNEVEESDIYSEEGDDDDFYSGSGSGSGSGFGSGGGFMLNQDYFIAKFTTDYPAAPSTSSSSPLSSSQVTVTDIPNQDVVKDMSTIPVLTDLLAVDTTTDAILTSPMPSSTISKDFNDIVPETRANNFRPRIVDIKHNTTVAAPHTSSAGPNVQSTLPDDTTAIIKDESITVSHVVAEKENENEIATTVDTKVNIIEEIAVKKDVEIVNMKIPNEIDDIFISDEMVSTNARKQDLIQDYQSSVQPPKESHVHDFSTSGSFLERRELLAAAVIGGLVGLMIAVLLVILLVYRMKKKDEGSYSLEEAKQPNGGYQKPIKQEEFYA